MKNRKSETGNGGNGETGSKELYGGMEVSRYGGKAEVVTKE
jgi:hypothetical protein